MSWWEKLVGGGIVEPIAGYFTKREERKALESQMKSQEKMKDHELEMAFKQRQIDLVSQGLTADMNWEMEFAKQASSTWKDEYTLIVVSIPAVLAFIPSMAKYVEQGFNALAKTPLWYQVMLCSIFLATYGIRYWRRTQSDT